MLVLGAGLAATALVAALRSGGFAGEITVAGDEDPYDRPPLTKELFARSAPEDLREQFSLAADAAAWIRARATGIEGGVVTLRDGAGRATTATAGAVVLALGSRPIVPVGWEGVRTLSRWHDAVALRTALAPGAHLVIAGAGWIGLELASSAAAEGVTVTVVEDTGRPLGRLLPEPVAERVTAWLRAVTPGTVTLVEGRVATASPTTLDLTDGRVVRGDVVVAALGARPATDWLPRQWLGPAGHVRTALSGTVRGASGIWAIGDCAAAPGGQHWNAAVASAQRCADALLGNPVADPPVPSVFSTMFGRRVELVGHASPGHEVLWREGRGNGWAALFMDGDDLVGGLVVDRPRDVAALRRLVGGGRPVLDRAAAADPARRLADAVRRR